MVAVAHERIVSDPAIMGGKPTVKGTRITVEPILDELEKHGVVFEEAEVEV